MDDRIFKIFNINTPFIYLNFPTFVTSKIQYLLIFGNGYYAPLVDLEFHYRKPIVYGMHPKIKITYRPTDAAKIIFDYEIRDTLDGSLLASGRSTQVFMDKQYQLVLYNPPFYEEWKQKWLSK